MAKQGKWNKSFWKKMDHLENLERLSEQKKKEQIAKLDIKA